MLQGIKPELNQMLQGVEARFETNATRHQKMI
jgi:hypothetical protein